MSASFEMDCHAGPQIRGKVVVHILRDMTPYLFAIQFNRCQRQVSPVCSYNSVYIIRQAEMQALTLGRNFISVVDAQVETASPADHDQGRARRIAPCNFRGVRESDQINPWNLSLPPCSDCLLYS